MREHDIINFIKKDFWMMQILHTASELNLPDWMIGAGFVRNKVWDYLHEYSNPSDQTTDIDLVYFDHANISEEVEKKYDRILKEKMEANWSTKNQARMHIVNNLSPFISSEDAVAHWPETATGIAVTLKDGELKLIAPHGIEDLVNLVIRLSPKFPQGLPVLQERVVKKKWLEKWPKLKMV